MAPFSAEMDSGLSAHGRGRAPRGSRIHVWLVSLVLLPLALLSLFVYGRQRAGHMGDVHSHLLGLASVHEAWLTTHLDRTADRLDHLAGRPEFSEGLRAVEESADPGRLSDLREFLDHALPVDGRLIGARVLDARGEELIAVGQISPVEPRSAPADPGRPSLLRLDSLATAPGLAEVWEIGVGSPDEPLGSLQIWYSGIELLRLAGDSAGLGRTGETLLGLRDPAGRLRFIAPVRFGASTPLALVGETPGRLPLEDAIEGREGVLEGNDYRNERVVAATRHVEPTGWGMVVKMDRSEAYADLADLRTQLGLGFLAIAALVLALTLVVARRLRSGEEGLLAANRRLRSTLLSSPFPASVHAEDGEMLLVSDSWITRTGYTREELPDLDAWTLRAHGERAGEIRGRIDALYGADGPVDEGLHAVRAQDGTELQWEFRSMALGPLPDGRRTVLSMAVDVTGRVEMEAALTRSRESLLKAGEMARVGAWEIDPGSGRVEWSAMARRIHGVGEDYDPSLEDAYAFFPRPGRTRLAEAVQQAIEEGIPYDLELPFVTAQGEELWIRTSGVADFEDGRCVLVHGVMQDITAAKEREQELERLNRALSFVSASNTALVRSPPDHDLLQKLCDVAIQKGGYGHVWIAYREDPASPLCLFQAGQDHALDLLSFETLKEEIQAAASVGVALVARGLGTGSSDWERRLAAEGLEALAVMPFPRESTVDGFLALAHTDAAALTSSEVEVLGDLVADLAYGLWVRALRQELLLVREAVENLSVGITILDATDPDLPVVYANRGFTEVTGYAPEELRGRPCASLQGPDTDPEAAARIEAAVREGRDLHLTLQHYRKSGEAFWDRLTIEPVRGEGGRPTHLVQIHEDVTERRALGIELEHRARLSAVGELAGGIAHDFRNILTASQGLVELSLSEDEIGEDARENLKELKRLVARGTAVTERLLMLSRRDVGEARTVSLTAFLTETAHLIDRTVRDDIVVITDLIDESVLVALDQDQFTAALLNLGRNAAQAMPKGGTLSIEALYPVRPGEPAWWPKDLGVDGDRPWVRVSVRDTGCGMDQATLEHAFDPYFTTKPSGEGTGLGLPMVYGAVEAMGGRVWIESEPGVGTVVHVLLATAEETGEQDGDPDDPESTMAGDTRPATILLAEDDTSVLHVFRKALERAGHTVLAGADGEEALAAFLHSPTDVDLVITDGSMPRLSGADLARAVWEVRPDVTVVVTSGFAPDALRRDFPEEPPGELVFLPKPLSIDELLEAVRTLRPPHEEGTP